MRLTGVQVKLLQDALLDAYDRDTLRQMLRICLDLDYDSLVSDGAFANQVYELIQWAERHSRTSDLIECAQAGNPTNAQLKAIYPGLLQTSTAVTPGAPLRQAPRVRRTGFNGALLLGALALLLAASALFFGDTLRARLGLGAPPAPSRTEDVTAMPEAVPPATSASAAMQTASPAVTPLPTPTSTATQPPPTATANPTSLPTSAPVAQPTATPVPLVPLAPDPTPTPSARCSLEGIFAGVWPTYQDRLGCNVGDAINTDVTYQEFQFGLMVWVKTTDHIYVLRQSGSWTQHANPWNPTTPVYSCAEAATAGNPQMGFGKLWCDMPAIRSDLGSSTSPEIPAASQPFQYFEGGVVFNLSDQSTLVLLNDGAWFAH